MLHLFKKKHVLPTGAQTALDLVRTREGKKYTKNASNLYKMADAPSTGRLQPSLWAKIITESRGLLEDKGLLEVAQAHLRVAGKLCEEGYEEVVGQGGSTLSEMLYGYMKPVKPKGTTAPPPYQDGARPSPKGWVCSHCGVQNPDWRDFCCSCGTPHTGPPPPPDNAQPNKPCPPESSSSHPVLSAPSAPLYPVLTTSGSYYQGPEAGDTQGPIVKGTDTQATTSAVQILFPSVPVYSLKELFQTPEALEVLAKVRRATAPDELSEWEDQAGPTHNLAPVPPLASTPRIPSRPPPLPSAKPKSILSTKPPPLPSRPQVPENWFPAASKVYVNPQGHQVTISVGVGDITTARVDVIVNAANSELQHKGGLARAISQAAGPSLQKNSNDLIASSGPIGPGEIAITGPGDIPINRIIHVVGPRYDREFEPICAEQLQNGIWNTLTYLSDQACVDEGITTVAFPLVSTGLYKYPLESAVRIIIATIREFIDIRPTQLTEIRIVTDQAERVSVMLAALQAKDPRRDNIVPSAVPSLPESQAYHARVKPAIKLESVAENQHSAMTDNTPRNVTKLGLQYVTFTPTQVSTLVANLPDPEKQPMPFYRRMEQIRKTYGCSWSDLSSLTEIRASDSFLPLMAPAFDSSQAPALDTYASGLTYCQQLKLWAQEALTELQGSLQDITQNDGESVEQYASRCQIQFEDLGFIHQHKAHRLILTKAFVEGLNEDLREKILSIRPDCIGGTLQDAVLVAKGFARSQAKEVKEKGKKKALALMMQDNEGAGAVLCPSLPGAPPTGPQYLPPPPSGCTPNPPNPAPYPQQPPPVYPQYPTPYPYPPPAPAYAPYYPQPPQQGLNSYGGNYGGQRQDRRQNGRGQGGPICWNCGIVGHVRRECRKPRQEQQQDGLPPRS
ncbi:uncharacterized protein LOC142475239 [Ascaphus truei]|uniref:uncharacterized protein LOC142475239 n=1 Tax=Ascaphus truei TaxID=8439 RepID=UPI003F59192D